MVVKTFEATVAQGRLEHDEPLAEFEGRRVRVTVTEEDPAPVSARLGQPDSEAAVAEEDEPEPPEWLDVETDIYVRMPVKGTLLKNVRIVDRGRARPCIILPEELPDD